MVVLRIRIPKEINVREAFPFLKMAHLRQLGAAPSWAPREWEMECLNLEEAQGLMSLLNANPGIRAHISEARG